MRCMIAAAAIAVSAILAAGCASQGPAADPGSPGPAPPSPAMPQVCTKNGPVVFAVAGRLNSPAPVLTGAMQSAAATAVREGSAIGLVDLDGRPRLVMAGAFRDPGVNSVALRAAQQHFLSSLTNAVEHIRAAWPHADVLDALNVAGHAIRAACPYGGTIYLEDSGLQETGVVNFRQTGMLSADPAAVASFLTRHHDLPYLADTTVVLAGIGDTAPPQVPLSIGEQDNLTAIWSAIAKAGGATSVQVDPAPVSGPAPVHVPAVLLVPLPAVSSVPGPGGIITYRLPGVLLFYFESATLVRTADAVLRPLAEQARRRHLEVSITGYASPEGSVTYNVALSKRRAIAVRDRLIALGLPPAQITRVTGAGTAGQTLSACLTQGQLVEAKCATLRRVMVTLSPAEAGH
jgi:OmpA-OmpF porin, OOP family